MLGLLLWPLTIQKPTHSSLGMDRGTATSFACELWHIHNHPGLQRLRKGRTPYYDLWDQERIQGRLVQTYFGYLGPSPHFEQEVSRQQVYRYLRRTIATGLANKNVKTFLAKTGLEVDPASLQKRIFGNDLVLYRLFVRVK